MGPRPSSAQRISKPPGYLADLDEDLLAVHTKDPRRNGCPVLGMLSDHGTRLWRSCDEVVVGFSGDGGHVVTTYILADGLGPTDVRVRTTDGVQTGRYRVRPGYFAQVFFEAAGTVLLDIVTGTASGLVRCDAGRCELVSDLGPGERP